jgi:protein-histidine pros-kinase
MKEGESTNQDALEETLNREEMKNLNILVVEDNPVNLKLITRFLSKMGHTVTSAENGLLALQKLEAGIFDLVFMDIQMPEMDGIETTRRIREAEKENSFMGSLPIPIIALTAHAMKGDREHFLKAGMDDYISKPVQKHELTEAIERVVRRESENASS